MTGRLPTWDGRMLNPRLGRGAPSACHEVLSDSLLRKGESDARLGLAMKQVRG